METGDDWLAADKLHHFLACFLITLLVSSAAARCRKPYFRRWSIPIGAVVSLAAGAAKEAADEVGVWGSAGSSVKDAVADGLGVAVACLLMFVLQRPRLLEGKDLERTVSMV